MKKITPLLCAICMLLLTGCGLSIYDDWKNSDSKALTGAGAVAGKDYINGLVPSENSRKYFAKLSSANNQPIETVSRTDNQSSQSGVRFVKNGGIAIPPGVTISFTNKGYCMDPHLPAPKAGEEYQLVPVTKLIPEELQGTYKKLVKKASAGDTNIQSNMQHLIWALRTAGTDAAYANNLTANQKRILDRCSEYSGQFEEFNANAKANSKMIKELLGVADSYLNVKIGGVTYKASDLLDPDIGNKKINEHLNQLITMSKSLPVERSGFNYGELQPGIYTDVRGSGFLQYTAKIANSTNKEFIFYPVDYAGQVGSGTNSQGLTFFATANTSQRQRVTGGDPDKVEVDDQREPEKDEKCKHVWQRISKKNMKVFSPEDVETINERTDIRNEKAAEIGKVLRQLQAQYKNFIEKNNIPDNIEVGSLIYYDKKTGKINNTPIHIGYDSRDIFTNYIFFGDHVGRTVNKNGQWYQYDMDSRELSPCKTEWGNFDSEAKKWSTDKKYIIEKSSEISVPIDSLSEYQIPVAFSHVHRGKENFWGTGYNVNGFSDQDLFIAEKEGISITVVKEGYWEDITYEPENRSISSQRNSGKDLLQEVDKLNEISSDFIYKCLKCHITIETH